MFTRSSLSIICDLELIYNIPPLLRANLTFQLGFFKIVISSILLTFGEFVGFRNAGTLLEIRVEG